MMPSSDLHTWLFGLSATCFLIGAWERVAYKAPSRLSAWERINWQSLGFALAAAGTAVLYA